MDQNKVIALPAVYLKGEDVYRLLALVRNLGCPNQPLHLLVWDMKNNELHIETNRNRFVGYSERAAFREDFPLKEVYKLIALYFAFYSDDSFSKARWGFGKNLLPKMFNPSEDSLIGTGSGRRVVPVIKKTNTTISKKETSKSTESKKRVAKENDTPQSG